MWFWMSNIGHFKVNQRRDTCFNSQTQDLAQNRTKQWQALRSTSTLQVPSNTKILFWIVWFNILIVVSPSDYVMAVLEIICVQRRQGSLLPILIFTDTICCQSPDIRLEIMRVYFVLMLSDSALFSTLRFVRFLRSNGQWNRVGGTKFIQRPRFHQFRAQIDHTYVRAFNIADGAIMAGVRRDSIRLIANGAERCDGKRLVICEWVLEVIRDELYHFFVIMQCNKLALIFSWKLQALKAMPLLVLFLVLTYE